MVTVLPFLISLLGSRISFIYPLKIFCEVLIWRLNISGYFIEWTFCFFSQIFSINLILTKFQFHQWFFFVFIISKFVFSLIACFISNYITDIRWGSTRLQQWWVHSEQWRCWILDSVFSKHILNFHRKWGSFHMLDFMGIVIFFNVDDNWVIWTIISLIVNAWSRIAFCNFNLLRILFWFNRWAFYTCYFLRRQNIRWFLYFLFRIWELFI